MNQLTVKEAIEQGYKYCWPQNDEICFLMKIEECPFDGKKYELLSKEPTPYGISDTTIKEILSDHLADQDEVADENGELCDIVEAIDYTEITKTVNEALSKKKYYYPSGILLVK